jgi:hypothetical protein
MAYLIGVGHEMRPAKGSGGLVTPQALGPPGFLLKSNIERH